MDTETRKKILKWGLIVAAVAGALFLIFAVFLNRGTLTVVAKAPYLVQVKDIKSQACSTDECSLVLAPGEYTILVQKTGYREEERRVSVPIAGEQKEEFELSFIPLFSSLGSEADVHMFEEPTVSADELEAAGLKDTPLFFEKQYVVYLKFDPSSRRQTLYARGIENGKLGEETVATSFLRTLKSYLIFPGIEKWNQIAVIDQTETSSTLYLVDLEQKSRESLLTYPYIAGVMWMPGSNNFLFEARDGQDISPAVYLYDATAKSEAKLGIKTPVQNIVPVNAERLIAVTNQSVLAEADPVTLEGALVGLGEIQATPDVLMETDVATPVTVEPPPLNVVDYSLTSNQARLIKYAPGIGVPEKAKLGADGKSVLILAGGQVYEIRFEE